MTAGITATGATNASDALFAKLDVKQKGYIDASDLKTAVGEAGADTTKTDEIFKQLDSNGDNKVTKSELSSAMDRVGDQLNAQLDQSRVQGSSTNAKPAASGAPHGGAGGAPPAQSDSESTTKYVAAADTNGDGTVSADEEAAYKKLQASVEAKAHAKVQEYKNNSGDSVQSSQSTIDVSA